MATKRTKKAAWRRARASRVSAPSAPPPPPPAAAPAVAVPAWRDPATGEALPLEEFTRRHPKRAGAARRAETLGRVLAMIPYQVQRGELADADGAEVLARVDALWTAWFGRASLATQACVTLARALDLVAEAGGGPGDVVEYFSRPFPEYAARLDRAAVAALLPRWRDAQTNQSKWPPFRALAAAAGVFDGAAAPPPESMKKAVERARKRRR